MFWNMRGVNETNIDDDQAGRSGRGSNQPRHMPHGHQQQRARERYG